jgi:glycosyltransferase involved in cell wall biosynthesis
LSSLRITILCPHVRIAGGVRAILTYGDRLARRGHDVEVQVPAKSALRAWWRTFSREGPAFMPGFAARIRWVARWRPGDLRDADVLLATAWQSAPVVAAAPPRSGEKFYLVQHYESLYHGHPARVDATYRLPLRKIVISTWLRDVMREKFDADAEVLVTPVDPRLFHRVPAVAGAGRVPAAADGGPPRVLMLHHDYAWKGVADGMEAVARVRGRGVDLVLVGFGMKAPRRPLPYDEFHENPPPETLARLYSGCQIYLCPSWDEGLGMPPMEAMACGAALVTYDNGGCRDYARAGATALVARRRDVDDLAAKLERLVADVALRRRIARAGQDLVTRAFDSDAAVDRLERLFRNRLGSR